MMPESTISTRRVYTMLLLHNSNRYHRSHSIEGMAIQSNTTGRTIQPKNKMEADLNSNKPKSETPISIYIIGAQCTGKTTLAEALLEQLRKDKRINSPLYLIREVARDVLRKYHFSRDDITTSPEKALELQRLILRAQFEEETKHSNSM